MAKRKQGAMKSRVTRYCELDSCGAKFSTNRGNKLYCSQPCQFKAWSIAHPRVSIQIAKIPQVEK